MHDRVSTEVEPADMGDEAPGSDGAGAVRIWVIAGCVLAASFGAMFALIDSNLGGTSKLIISVAIALPTVLLALIFLREVRPRPGLTADPATAPAEPDSASSAMTARLARVAASAASERASAGDAETRPPARHRAAPPAALPEEPDEGFAGPSEEALMNELLRRSNDAIDEPRAIIGPDREIIHANAAFFNFFRRAGSGDGDPVSRTFGNDPAQIREFAQICAEARAGRACQRSLPLSPAQGGPGVRRVFANPVPEFPGYIVVRMHDVPRDPGTIAAVAERNRFASMLDALNCGYYELDVNGRLIYCNATLARWLALPTRNLSSRGLALTSVLAEGSVIAEAPFDPFGGTTGEGTGEARMLAIDGREFAATIVQTLARNALPNLFARGVVRTVKDEARRAAAPEANEVDARLQRLFDEAPIGLAFIDAKGMIRRCNTPFRDLFGTSSLDVKGMQVRRLVAEASHEKFQEAIDRVIANAAGERVVDVVPRQRPDRVLAVKIGMVDAAPGAASPLLTLYCVDATEQRQLESQVTQAQKMQAVGQLAGGIAHDFNNLLTAMIGYCDLLLQRQRPGEQNFADTMQIKQNANRAADLVRQLLAFSRQQTLKPKVLKVTDLIADISPLLRRLVGANIKLEVQHSRDLGFVRVDQSQFQQVIINLVVNARDAMPSGGEIRLETKFVKYEQPRQHGAEQIPPGDYVRIDVIDHGTGISAENLARIFDPFFTTKEAGRGTGLGLSMVYGIVRQTGGYVSVTSTVGRGSTFTILLPRHQPRSAAEAEPVTQGEAPARDLTGAGTVLIVEDEDPVRAFSVRAMRNKGYTVHEAASGIEALEVLDKLGGPVDLIITDVMMPQMDGPELIRRVRERWPQTKIICISGYAEESFRDRIGTWEDIWFLPKPYSLNQLAALAKDAIGGSRRPSA
jgi:two-component system cell cycle sensor histidine kinase/response regulator CckA